MSDASSWLVLISGLAGSLAILAWVVAPAWRGHVWPSRRVDPRAVALLAEREALLSSLKDLDADHADGRMGEQAWEEARAEAVERGARVLAALDQIGERHAGESRRLAERIEAEIAEGDPRLAVHRAAQDDGDMDDSAQAARDDRAAVLRCPACEAAVDASDRFCSSCGARLAAEDEASAEDRST